MEYQFGQNANYEDFSSGRVIYHVEGMPNFPVRLAQEIFGRCLAYSAKKEDICLYDCCCGGGYLLTVLGFLNQGIISEIVGSDIDRQALRIAKNNLSLLSNDGISKRIDEIKVMQEKYQKESHNDAMRSAYRLKEMIRSNISVQLFQANVLENIELLKTPDIIITDVPYGNLVSWENGSGDVSKLLKVIADVCGERAIVAISMDKKQKISADGFMRLEKQQIGKRRFEIYRLDE